MARPISHDVPRSHYPAIAEPEFNTRNDVPVTPCTVLSALVKKIADFVVALFQTIVNFFRESASAQPASSSLSRSETISRPEVAPLDEDEEFLLSLINKYGYSRAGLLETENDQFFYLLARDFVDDLVMDTNDTLNPIPVVSTVCVDDLIGIARLSYNGLDKRERFDARQTFLENIRPSPSPQGSVGTFLCQVEAIATNLSTNPAFKYCALRARNVFSLGED